MTVPQRTCFTQNWIAVECEVSPPPYRHVDVTLDYEEAALLDSIKIEPMRWMGSPGDRAFEPEIQALIDREMLEVLLHVDRHNCLHRCVRIANIGEQALEMYLVANGGGSR